MHVDYQSQFFKIIQVAEINIHYIRVSRYTSILYTRQFAHYKMIYIYDNAHARPNITQFQFRILSLPTPPNIQSCSCFFIFSL